MTTSTCEATVAALIAPGKGILAADESQPTIEKRFKAHGIPCTESSRRAYRELLCTTPGLNESVSGVILFEETLRQKTLDGATFPEMLLRQGIVPGIKVDKGTTALANFAGEKMTEGLDGLRGRLEEYGKLGAAFTKWRAVLAIGDHTPTRTCIDTNAELLARFAALSQEAELVPVVEPEVLMDGAHTIDRCEWVTGVTLKRVFAALSEHGVVLERMLLKTGMVLSGAACAQQAGAEEVLERTLRCFRRFVPAAVPGIMFLSGGQSDVAATQRLNVLCREGNVPWRLSFSFGRALQAPALKAWKGQAANESEAQAALYHRATCNGCAVLGVYVPGMESEHVSPPLV